MIFQDDLLRDKVALITGGGTGIGASIAHLFSRLGAKVVIASRKQDRLEKAAQGLTELTGNPVTPMVCNIRDREQISAVTQSIMEQFGAIDILVNNGGGQFMSPAEHIREKGWDAVISTNLTGTWDLSRAVAKAHMLKHGGTIINITMLTSRGFPGMAHSCAARAGVEGLTKTLAVEWAARGIRVNAVQPGIIASNGMRNYPSWEQIVAKIRSDIPMKRLGHCDDIANIVTFLASPAGQYITGQIWAVDGGQSLWGSSWPIPDPKEPAPIDIQTWPWETDP